MTSKEISLRFDMDNEIERRVYYALMNLPEFYKEPDISKSIIKFINNLVDSIGECEERESRCQEQLKSLFGRQGLGRVEWQ